MSVSVVSNTIARYSLLILLFLLPFFVFPVSWITVAQDKALLSVLLLSIAFFSYTIGRLVAGFAIVPRHVILFSALLLPVCYALSALFSGASVDSYVSGLGDQGTVTSILFLSLLLSLTASLFSGHNKPTRLPVLTLLAGGSVLLLFQVLRPVFFSDFTFGGVLAGSASSLVGGWNDLGIVAGFFLIASSTLAREYTLAYWRRICLGVLGILAALMILIVAESEIWFAISTIFFFLAGLTLVHTRTQLYKNMLRAASLPLALAFTSLLFALGTSAYFSHLPRAFQITHTEVRPSWQTTFDLGKKVFDGGNALFGTGPATFSDQWGLSKPLAVNQSNFWNTEFNSGVGLIPTAFVTAGYFGVLAWTSLLLAILYRVFVTIRLPSEKDFLHQALLASALLLVWFHVSGSPSFAVSCILFFVLGLIVAHDTSDMHAMWRVAVSVRSRRGMLAGVLGLLIVGAVCASSYATARALISNTFVSKSSVDYAAGKGLPHSLELIQTALVWYPSNSFAHRAAVEAGLVKLQQLMQQGDASNSAQLQTTLEQTITDGISAVSINSKDYQNWLALAALYQQLANIGISGASQHALGAFKKAAAVNPTNPVPLLNAAYLTLTLGDATSAVAYLNAALGLKPDLASGYYLRSQAKEILGESQDAIADAQKAISLAENDPIGWYNLGTILYAQNDYADAISVLQKAISLQSDYSNAYFLLSLSLERSGQSSAAIEAMQKVLSLNPGDQTVVQALAQLEIATSTTTKKP